MARMPPGRVAEPDEVVTVCVHRALDATAVTGVVMTLDAATQRRSDAATRGSSEASY